MLENIFDWDCKEETNFWAIICDQFYPIETLPSKTRNQVRRSLRDCDIRIITGSELIDSDGYNVYKKSFERYHHVTSPIASKEQWTTHINNSTKHEFWGVYRKNTSQLIAYAINSIKGTGVEYNTLKAIPGYMNKHYPYFGLLFEMNRHYLADCNYSYVSDGFRSITGHSNIQPFLERNFRFRKCYCRMIVYYRWWLNILITVAYPFRQFIPIRQIKNLLNLESIRRGR